MNKRLRKKTRRGEFAVYGVNVRFRVTQTRPSDAYGEDEVDAFIAFAEANDLAVGGGVNTDLIGRFFVTAVCPYKHPRSHLRRFRVVSVTGAHVAAMYAHFASRADKGVTDVFISPRIDAWHGPFSDD